MVKQNTAALKGFYDVDRTIGCGGFAKVKLATHLATGEKVAIKIMEKGLLKDDLPRVRIELKALKCLSHEHICKLYQVLETDTHFFIIMEYCSGGELFDHIVEKNRLSEEESRTFFRQIISAVAYLHSHGYAHRDLKPENVLLDSSQKLKLIDFGLCAQPDGGVQKGALFTSCGSPTYAAPELVLGKQYIGAQVDVWAMGVLLYALLAGHLPFDDQNIDRLYRKILSGRYEEPTYISLPSRRLIRAMLQVDPLQRITVDQLLIHPWMTAGGLPPIQATKRSLQPQQQQQTLFAEDDEDIVDLMALYHGANAEEMRRHLAKGRFDYDTATYWLLVGRRRRGLPIGLVPGLAARVPIRVKSADSIKSTATPTESRPTTRSASKIARQHLDILHLPPPSSVATPFSMCNPITPTRGIDYDEKQRLKHNVEDTPKREVDNLENKRLIGSAKINPPILNPPAVDCHTPRRWVDNHDLANQLLSPAPPVPPQRVLRNQVVQGYRTPTNSAARSSTSGSSSIRKPMKRIRSPNMDGECSPVPNKKATPGTPVLQTAEMCNKASQNGIENGGSARKMLESIERSLHRVKNVLTPRKNSEASSQPVILNNKNLSNVSTTQCTNPEFVIAELANALRNKGIDCHRKGFTLRGKMEPPRLASSPNAGTAAPSGGCSFELEICYLPQMGLLPSHTPNRRSGGGSGCGNTAPLASPVIRTRNAKRRSAGEGPNQVVPPQLVGIRRKRLKGDSWCYKKVCEQVLALTATKLMEVRESMV